MQEASPHNQARSRLLKLYSSYRLFLSALLLWLGQLDSSPIYFGHSDSGLFSTIAAAYLIASLLNVPLFQGLFSCLDKSRRRTAGQKKVDELRGRI